MLAAVAAQLLTGWLRVKALDGTYSNFSTFSRVSEGDRYGSHPPRGAGAVMRGSLDPRCAPN